jgi:hypothetical protein
VTIGEGDAWLTDPDPALFVSGFQDANKNKFFFSFFGLILTIGKFTDKIFIVKKSQNS